MMQIAQSPGPAMVKFGIFTVCFRGITQLPSSEWHFSWCFTLPPCLYPCLQVALCIWGWCSEPSSGVDFQTKWAGNSACWSQWLSMASSPSSHPLSKATACSSFVAWCLALGEYFFSCEYFLYTQSSFGFDSHHVRGRRKNGNADWSGDGNEHLPVLMCCTWLLTYLINDMTWHHLDLTSVLIPDPFYLPCFKRYYATSDYMDIHIHSYHIHLLH